MPTSRLWAIPALMISAASYAGPVDFGGEVLSFEDGTSPIICSRGSRTAISGLHSKLGEHSLEWEWNRNGAYLEIPGPVPYMKENPDPKETSVSSFVFWVYSDTPADGRLEFAFMKGEKECCSFSYGLSFAGWRGAWVAFDRDMEGTPEEGMDRIIVRAPEGVRKGRLFFDGIIRSSFQDVRHHTPDWQAPFINKDTKSHWLVLNRSWDLTLDIPEKEVLSADDIADMETVRSRFTDLVTSGKRPLSHSRIREIYESYGITVNPDGTIRGKPVFFTRYGETFISLGIRDASRQWSDNGQLLRQANDNLFQIALAHMHETDSLTREEYAGMYVRLTRLLLDQGFAAGSGLGTLHHLGYSMRNFYTAPVIMRDVLVRAGLDDDVQQAMEWFSGVGEVKVCPETPGMDIDAFNTSLMGRVASVLMLDDTPYKYAYMQALTRWIDNGFRYTDGLMPCFKRDGSVVHHRKSYPAYATGGMDGAVNAVWMLAGTGLAISEESHRILKNALLEMRFYCNLKSFPLAMSGRHPDGRGSLIPRQYALLADAGSPDGSEKTDRELAAAYLRLNGEDGTWAEKFASEGITAEAAPVGTHYYGFNCSMTHRMDEWSVTLAGHSRYLWATETYQGANLFGRYLTHGSMQILADGRPETDSFGSGFRVEGWDWCHIPGTTAAAIPMEQMEAVVLNVDEFSGYEEMLLSDEWFAGGTTHKGKYGAFGMKLHEHDKYNGSLRANKSFFAFGNRIVALGSGIKNALEGSEVHTTLFQNSLEGECDAIMSVSHPADTVLYDRFGNAFFVKDADITVTRGLQHSLHEETGKPTEGYFERAYICHGNMVSDGGYEYMAVVHPSPEECAGYAENRPYEVVRKDNAAHIVRDCKDGVTALVIFDSIGPDDDELILAASPSIILWSRSAGGTVTLSLSNPDLALYRGESDDIFDSKGRRIERSVYGREWIDSPCLPTEVTLTVRGKWELAVPHEGMTLETEGGLTRITAECLEAATEEVVLRPASYR